MLFFLKKIVPGEVLALSQVSIHLKSKVGLAKVTFSTHLEDELHFANIFKLIALLVNLLLSLTQSSFRGKHLNEIKNSSKTFSNDSN